MGSSSSRLGSHPSSNHPNQSRPNRSILSSLVCGGGYSSRATLQVGEHQGESLARNGQYFDRGNDPVQNAAEDSSMISSIGAGFDFPNTEIGSSSQTVVPAGPGTYVGEGFRNAGTSHLGKCLSASKELVSHSVSAGCNRDESSRYNSSAASTTFKEQEQHSSNPVFVNSSANMDVVNGSADKNASQARHLFMRPSSSSSSHGIVNSGSDDNLSIENPVTEVVAHRSTNADVGSVHVSDIPLPLPSRRSDSLPETIPSGLGFLMSNREQSRENETEVHVDIMSISSNFLSSTNGDMSSRESRRNGRRLFWDAFSRRSSRRFNDLPSILSSTDDTEDLGFHDRWLLGLSGDLDEQSGADFGHQVNRTPSLSERRRHTRSEVWERLRGGLDGNGHRGTTCPTGIHPRGMCSCSSFLMTEESSARASISRIVMLAEALFEVLDEIHRQPVSLSLSVVSVPAPASVVDSFPLKSHTKLEKLKHVDDVEQCYICLAEYEEGDKIRVLPCHHEYHMSCVDKWLKEIRGVCPLCRGDVCEGLKDDCSVTNSEISSI